jgi:endonuclease/exonuclease/phosphatase family metal-dependent hydrolase
MKIFRSILALCALAAFLLPQQVQAQDRITVMTQNQYLGADLMPLFAAPDATTFNAALVAALEQVAANNFAARAESLAANIGERNPDLIGLQEVWFFACFDDPTLPPEEGCSNPKISGAFGDHLVATLSALNNQGTTYAPAASVTNLNLAGLPFLIDGYPATLVAMDRDVILARSGLIAAPVDFGCAPDQVSNTGCNYTTVIEAPTPFGAVPVERGFVGVDVTLDGQDYRFVNTHLEVFQPDPFNPESRGIQALQAQELLETLYATTPWTSSLVLVGDFNSSPEHEPLGPIIPPYLQFVGSGFNDVWTLREDPNSGFTCCQDADLLNKQTTLNERIDMIFSLDTPFQVKKAHVLGGKGGDKTPPPGLGLWPSDHGSVVTEINY